VSDRKRRKRNDRRPAAPRCVRIGDVWPNPNSGTDVGIVDVGLTVGRFKELAAGTIEVELFAIPSDGKVVIRRPADRFKDANLMHQGRIVNVGRTVGQYKELALGDIEIEIFSIPRSGKFVIER